MADKFSFKKGARLPSREMTLTSESAFDLSTASSVTFVYRRKGIDERIVIPAVIVDAPTKKIRVDFGDVDVATIGQYEWHIEAVFSSKTMVFPERGFHTYSVTETIDGP
jgi:hypothetical protein